MKSFDDLEKSQDIFGLKLTNTTVINQELIEKHPVFKMILGLLNSKTKQGRPHTLKKLMGLLCNACICHGQIEFLLSKNLLNNLIKQDCHINRSVLNGSEYNAFMRLAKDQGLLFEIEPPSSNDGKNLAGRYRLEVDFVHQFIASPEYESGFEAEFESESESANTSSSPQSNPPQASEKTTGRTVAPLAYDPSIDPEFNPDKPWLKTMAQLRSEYVHWFFQYPIDGDGYKKFDDDVIEFASSARRINTSKDCPYEEWPDQVFILSEVEKKLEQRFKKNDRNPDWNFSGPICQNILGTLRGWIERNAVTRIPEKIKADFHAPVDVEDTEFLAFFKEESFDSSK